MKSGYDVVIFLPPDIAELDECNLEESADDNDGIYVEVYQNIDVFFSKSASPFEEIDTT